MPIPAPPTSIRNVFKLLQLYHLMRDNTWLNVGEEGTPREWEECHENVASIIISAFGHVPELQPVYRATGGGRTIGTLIDSALRFSETPQSLSYWSGMRAKAKAENFPQEERWKIKRRINR